MLLKNKDGIQCDFCAAASRTKFTYYSIESSVIQVSKSRSLGARPADFNHDTCEICYNQMLDRCKKHLASKIIAGRVKCDLCAQNYGDTFRYHQLRIAKVDVNIEAENPTKVERNIMDFNVADCCFAELVDKVNKVVEKNKHEGEWS